MADGNMLGGGVVVALAAGLWLVYLIPTWLRRREYMATERNAVRLQQTLRILAEAAEVPEEIRMEATARDIAEQQKLLRKVQQRAVAEAKERAVAAARAEEQLIAEKRAAADEQERAEAAAAAQARAWAAAEARARVAAARERADAAERKARAAGAVLPANAARGIRRGRMAASAVLLVGVVAVVVGAVGGWLPLPLIGGAVLVAGSLAVLGQLARRVAVARSAARPVARRIGAPGALYDHADHLEEIPVDDVEVEVSEPWTPRPLPRPLHLSRGTIAASTMASISAAAELRRAANRAELEERAERLAAERRPRVATIAPAASAGAAAPQAAPVVPAEAPAAAATPAQPAAAPASRYARMGIVGEPSSANLDLDAALARRRAG